MSFRLCLIKKRSYTLWINNLQHFEYTYRRLMTGKRRKKKKQGNISHRISAQSRNVAFNIIKLLFTELQFQTVFKKTTKGIQLTNTCSRVSSLKTINLAFRKNSNIVLARRHKVKYKTNYFWVIWRVSSSGCWK